MLEAVMYSLKKFQELLGRLFQFEALDLDFGICRILNYKFVPKYSYSIKGHKCAIPYNGEEVKLYWTTQYQYYIKTGLLFRDYT